MTDTINDLAVPENPDDMERYVDEPAVLGEPVDMRPVRTTYADVTALVGDRKPIIPAWMRSSDGRRTRMHLLLTLAWYYPAFHAWHTPSYLLRVLRWGPVGLYRLPRNFWRWAYDMEQWGARQHHITRNHTDDYLALQRVADKHRRGRVPVFLLVMGAAVVGAALMYFLAPLHWQVLAVTIVLTIFARAGRPADQPILDRVTQGRRFVRLTAEMVRNALVAINVPGIREAAQLDFPMPIHQVGPGYLARVNLPAGVTAVKVLERRPEMASALRLPVDQVWPEIGPDHPGQMDLWVGREPASKMGQPTWDLAKSNAVTSVFDPHPFSTDARQRPIMVTLFERNFLIGGQPGSGKSYGARTFATIAALDPTCEMKIAEFKGTGDFLDMAHLCSTYAVGVDDQAFHAGIKIIDWALAECERRGKRIKAARERGEAPLGKVTPELARKKGSGLHPVFILLDEVHELFAYDKDTADKAERAIKRGRALGIIIVLATQIPDSKSLPPNITRCVTVRWCMSVGGQVENDMILGTGAYKRGLSGTAYRAGVDQGWGVVVGLEKAGSVRGFFPTPEVQAAIVARATQLRGGVVGDQQAKVKARNMLADVRAVLLPGESGLPWAVLAERLAELAPEVYAGITGDMVREALARYDVPSQDVKVKVDGDWTNIKGARRAALDEAVTRHAIED